MHLPTGFGKVDFRKALIVPFWTESYRPGLRAGAKRISCLQGWNLEFN